MLKLIQTDWGKFDLAFDDPAAADADAAVATLVYAVLFTDAAGPVERVGDVWSRRGWWADEAAGTGLWHVRRQPLTDAARREAEHMIRQALIERSAALSEVSVSLVQSSDAAGNVSSVLVDVTGLHNGRKFAIKAAL